MTENKLIHPEWSRVFGLRSRGLGIPLPSDDDRRRGKLVNISNRFPKFRS